MIGFTYPFHEILHHDGNPIELSSNGEMVSVGKHSQFRPFHHPVHFHILFRRTEHIPVPAPEEGCVYWTTLLSLTEEKGETTGGYDHIDRHKKVNQQGYLAQSRWFADLYTKKLEETAPHLMVKKQAEVKSSSQDRDLSRMIDTLLTVSQLEK